MKPVLTASEMAEVDRRALERVSIDTLISRAGTAIAHHAIALLGAGYGHRVLVVAGRGHNGDDGRVAASQLRRRGVAVRVVTPKELDRVPAEIDLVIDAAYGTGFHGEYISPRMSEGQAVLAVDLPSGLDADLGEAGEGVASATTTVTFGAYKPGLLLNDGPRLSGNVFLEPIDLDAEVTSCVLIEDADLELLPERARTSHKWSSAVFVLAGSAEMRGAADLSVGGAERAGAGMVRTASPGIDPGRSSHDEAVAIGLPNEDFVAIVAKELERCQALVAGPGLGTGEKTAASLLGLITKADCPAVLDADALTILSQVGVAEALSGRRAPTVLTPHDGEFERLTGKAPGADRIEVARRLSKDSGAVVLLKGATTVVAAPSGFVHLVTAGTPQLATAGSGDVLSGMIGAFLARGLDAALAASLAAHVHGLAARRGRRAGLVASELPDLVSDVLSDVPGAPRVSASDRRSPPAFGRPVVAEIDVAAYEDNVAALRRLVAPASLCAVVKADAYGHGALDIAPAALRAGAELLAVAFVDEALALREAGVEGRILVLMEPEPDGLEAVLEHGLELTVYRPSTLEALAERGETLDRHGLVHLKLDSGMHRLGAAHEQLVAMALWTDGHPFLELVGLSTHFAVADELENPFTSRQLTALVDAAGELQKHGVAPRTLHAANSAGALGHPESRLDMVRVGLASYGLLPSPSLASALGEETLRPVMRLVSKVHLVRHLSAGERLGYGLRFELPEDGIVGVVPVGYADGVARSLSSTGGEVLIGGLRRAIAGTISMDQLVVDLGSDNTVRSGDEVVLLGSQDDEEISADEWAKRLGTINYEVLTGIGARVPRRVRERT